LSFVVDGAMLADVMVPVDKVFNIMEPVSVLEPAELYLCTENIKGA
jgi:hypothetical protein